MEDLEEVEFLTHATVRREAADGVRYICSDLSRVNLETGRVRRLGGDVLLNCDRLSSMVLVGTTVYIIGGGECLNNFKKTEKEVGFIHCKVSRINLVDFEDGWREVPCFKANEDGKLPCVTFHDKIFIFGGFTRDHISDGSYTYTNSAGEVYDPALNRWAFLPKPDSADFLPKPDTDLAASLRIGGHVSSPVLVDHVNNCIIVHLFYLGSIYAYYPDEGIWSLLVSPFCLWTKLTVLFDDILIFHKRSAQCPLIAYDLVTNQWLKPIISVEFYAHGDHLRDRFDALIHMKPHGTFCFAAYKVDPINRLNETYLKFLKFSVQRTSNQDLLFNFISYNDIYVDERSIVHTFLPIPPTIGIPTDDGSQDSLSQEDESKVSTDTCSEISDSPKDDLSTNSLLEENVCKTKNECTEYNSSVKLLAEKLSDALLNVSLKDDLVKQHAKVAEEAVAGWEKAEKEATTLRQQLETAIQQKSAVDSRANHLDVALKECVRQLRLAREENNGENK